MTKIRTHYDNLGVSRNAQPEVIKAAYKVLAQKYHPDRNPDNPDAERIMKIINTAYQVLIDPVRRAEHDKWIDEQERRAGQSYQSANANQSSNAYQNTANGSSSAGHSNKHASQNTHHQTNGYQRYYEYANGNQDKHSRQSDDKQKSNNRQRHYYKNDDRKIANKPSFWSFGRMRRTTYALFSIPTLFVLLIIRAAMEGAVSSMDNYSSADLFLMTIIELLPFYFLIFLGIKRLHDCDYKGWWILVPFVVAVIWFVRPTQGTNRFGDDPRDDYFDGDIEIESDYSFWGVVAISILINISLINNALEIQKSQIQSSVEQNHTPTYQDNQPSNTQTPNISSDDIVTPNINSELQLNPQLVLVEAQKRYDNAVANINAVWSSLPPSTQEFLRAEQRAINKNREADCTAYGNAQSTDRDLAKAYRYLCEVPQLNERAEYLKTQVNTVVTPSTQNTSPAYQSNQNGYNLNYLINDTVKKSLLFLDRDSASYDGYSHKLESQDITHIDVNHDGIKDAVVALRYCEVSNCHMTTKSSELAVYLGVGNNQYQYGDIKTLGIDMTVYVDTIGNIYTQSKYYSEHEDPACCPSVVIDNGFNFKNGKLKEMN